MDNLKDTEGYLQANTDDLNLYFSGTFLKIKHSGTDLGYCFIESFVPTIEGRKMLCFRKAGQRQYIELPVEQVQLDFSFPTVGAYNYLKTVILAQRKTARQNKKGLCSGTFSISPVHEKFLQFGQVPEMFRMKNGWGWTHGNVVKTFGEIGYHSLDKAYRAVAGCQAFARAVSPDFYVAQGICSEEPSLWHRQTFVGNMPNDKTINVVDAMLAQETIDQFKKEGVRINV